MLRKNEEGFAPPKETDGVPPLRPLLLNPAPPNPSPPRHHLPSEEVMRGGSGGSLPAFLLALRSSSQKRKNIYIYIFLRFQYIHIENYTAAPSAARYQLGRMREASGGARSQEPGARSQEPGARSQEPASFLTYINIYI